MVVVSSAGAGFAALLIQASDEFSSWIIGQALGADDHAFATELAERMVDPLKDPTEQLQFALIIFVGILMVITAIIQLALMIVRYGMLVLLVGVLPLTAAATNTEMGMMWFKRAVALAGRIHPLQTGGGADLCHRDQADVDAGGAGGLTPPEGTPRDAQGHHGRHHDDHRGGRTARHSSLRVTEDVMT